MNTDNFNQQNTSETQYFYVHRAKATLHISPTTPLTVIQKSPYLTGSSFTIKRCNKIFTDFKNTSYSPLEVTVRFRNKTKHWAYINYVKNTIHVDSKYPIRQIEQFLHDLQNSNLGILVDHTDYTYVEICCRHPFKDSDKVVKALDTLRERFYVQKTKKDTKELGKGEEYSHLFKDLFLDGYFNIKTYKLVDGPKSANPTLSTTVEPKLEIQLLKPHSLEVAYSQGVPVLKAIVSALHIATIPMDKEFELNDYSLITESTKFSQNKKVFSCLTHVESKTLPDLPDYINRHLHPRKLVGAIWYEAKRANEICAYLHISDSTFRRTVKYLGNVIEKRGDRKSGYLYGVDVTSLYNNSQLSSVISTTSHKHSLKKTVLTLIFFAFAASVRSILNFSRLTFS